MIVHHIIVTLSVLLSSPYPGLVKIQFSLTIIGTLWLVKKEMLFTGIISIGLMWDVFFFKKHLSKSSKNGLFQVH